MHFIGVFNKDGGTFRTVDMAAFTANAVAPGLIDTPMVKDAMVSPEIRRQAVEGAPVRRIGVPDDIAAAVAYLVSEEASFVTGQVLSPNGGRYM